MPTVTLKSGKKYKFPYSATGKVKAHVFHKNNSGSGLKNNPDRLNYYGKKKVGGMGKKPGKNFNCDANNVCVAK
tara:strand:- start:1197 stop:1418 length:222 start_codon:yes stop_codon:yes gene_type:complete